MKLQGTLCFGQAPSLSTLPILATPISSFPTQALAEASAALHHQHLAAQAQLVGGGALPGGVPTVLPGGVPAVLQGGIPTVLPGGMPTVMPGGVSTVLSGGGVPTVLSGGGVPTVLQGGVPTLLSSSGGSYVPGVLPGASLPGSLPGVLPGVLPHALPTSIHPVLAAQVRLACACTPSSMFRCIDSPHCEVPCVLCCWLLCLTLGTSATHHLPDAQQRISGSKRTFQKGSLQFTRIEHVWKRYMRSAHSWTIGSSDSREYDHFCWARCTRFGLTLLA